LSDPSAHCQPPRVPAISATHLPYKIVQTPKMLKYTLKASLAPDEGLLEYFCAENEKDVQHFQ
jgi:hypothetical protein